MANCPTYPAESLDQAINLTIDNANRFNDILNGDINTFVPTCSGGGQVPSVAKALSEAAAYKVPIAWAATDTENDLLQPRVYNNNVYVPITVPAYMDAAPSSVLWRLYGAGTAEAVVYDTTTVAAALDSLTPVTDTLTNFSDAAASVNTSGKSIAKLGFNSTDSKMYYAIGADATSVWRAFDGSGDITPA